MQPFFIVGFPRSRTAWLANLFTYGPVHCFHEALRECGGPEELVAKFEGVAGAGNGNYGRYGNYATGNRTDVAYVGDADSIAPLFLAEIEDLFPTAKWVIVNRPRVEAEASYVRFCQQWPELRVSAAHGREVFDLVESRLDGLWEGPESRVRVVEYAELDRRDVCAALWQFLLPQVPFNYQRWEMLDQLQVNVLPPKVRRRISWPKCEELVGRVRTAMNGKDGVLCHG